MATSMKTLGAIALHLSAALAHQAPSASGSESSALRSRAIDLELLRPEDSPGTYVRATVVASEETPAVLRKRSDYVETATAYVKTIVPDAEFRLVEDHYIGTNGLGHVNFKQTVHGLDVDNADFGVNIAADGSVFSYGHSFFNGTIPADSPLRKREYCSPVDALNSASSLLSLAVGGTPVAEPTQDTETYTITGTTGAVSDPEAKLVYYVKDGALALSWRVETDVYSDWLLTYVDANDNTKLHGAVNYKADADATYLVYPWGINDPTDVGAERKAILNPWDLTSSEFTYQNDGTTEYQVTRGNNGAAQWNPTGTAAANAWETNYRPTATDFNFSYAYDPSMADPESYRDAATVQLFYTTNVFHDVLYALGFTEAAGNFEANNNGQGGLGGDFAILNSQDGNSTNNADMTTPPDGRMPRMRMYLWTRSTPPRDGAFEAGVVIHEYTHGLSTRLTGGPANSGCLSSLEAGGMGEGWGDFYATAVRIKANDTRETDYPMGAWVYNGADGIRTYPYSTSLTTNPYTYALADMLTRVHQIGTVWATILYEVMWNLIEKHGLSTEIMPEFDGLVPTDGKFLTMKLVLDGMALQPCNPNFVDARDAILDADLALTGGSNACELWTAFAKRGLGAGAVYSRTARVESFVIEEGVC